MPMRANIVGPPRSAVGSDPRRHAASQAMATTETVRSKSRTASPNAVDDCPNYRMVGSIGDRDSKGAAKAHAVFRPLDSNPVVTISVHVPLCLSKIKSGHIGGAARRELDGKESAQSVR